MTKISCGTLAIKNENGMYIQTTDIFVQPTKDTLNLFETFQKSACRAIILDMFDMVIAKNAQNLRAGVQNDGVLYNQTHNTQNTAKIEILKENYK